MLFVRVCDKFFLQHVFVFVVLQALLVNQLTLMSQQINNYLECRGPELRAEASGKETPLTGSGMCTQIYVVLVARMFIMITKCMCLCGGTAHNCTLGLKGLLLESMDLSLVLDFFTSVLTDETVIKCVETMSFYLICFVVNIEHRCSLKPKCLRI